MDEKEILIQETTKKALDKAKNQKMNEAQTKLYVDSEVQKVLDDINNKSETDIKIDNKVEEAGDKTDDKASNKNNDEPATNVRKTVTKTSKSKVYEVHTPVKNFCGIIAGVHFAYGQAKVQPGWILNWFKEHGYRIEEVSK